MVGVTGRPTAPDPGDSLVHPALPYFYAARQTRAEHTRGPGTRHTRARRRRLPMLRTLFRPTPTRLPAPQRVPVTARQAAPGS
jgi:hypothetical protein